jgi:hypothetical protein
MVGKPQVIRGQSGHIDTACRIVGKHKDLSHNPRCWNVDGPSGNYSGPEVGFWEVWNSLLSAVARRQLRCA